jgi:hypothetical protein
MPVVTKVPGQRSFPFLEYGQNAWKKSENLGLVRFQGRGNLQSHQSLGAW